MMKLRYLLFFIVLFLVGCTSTPKDITITFVTNGGETLEAIHTTNNTSLQLPIPVRLGYDFQGWYDEENILYTSPNQFSSSLTLYAKWALSNYTVTFYDDDIILSTSQVTMNDTIVPPTPPQKENMIFARWEPALTKVTNDASFQAIYLPSTSGLIFSLADDHYVVSGYEGTSSEVIIPSMISNKPVTVIDSLAFAGKSILTSVTLPNTITHIKDKAFYEAANLSNIVFPESLELIGKEAFYNCFYLSTVTITARVIGESAFYGCSNLANIQLTNRVEEILSWAFLGCSDLVTITIPTSVTSIGNHLFSWCQKLDYIYTTPDNLTHLQTLFANSTHIYTHFVITSSPE